MIQKSSRKLGTSSDILPPAQVGEYSVVELSFEFHWSIERYSTQRLCCKGKCTRGLKHSTKRIVDFFPTMTSKSSFRCITTDQGKVLYAERPPSSKDFLGHESREARQADWAGFFAQASNMKDLCRVAVLKLGCPTEGEFQMGQRRAGRTFLREPCHNSSIVFVTFLLLSSDRLEAGAQCEN